MNPEQTPYPSSLLLLLPDHPDDLLLHAVLLFTKRMQQRWRIACHSLSLAQYDERALQPGERLLLLGSAESLPLLAQVRHMLHIQPLADAEGYRLCAVDTPTDPLLLVDGADSHGILYGLGRLLRNFPRYLQAQPPLIETYLPATRDRGVYFATHFQNFYEGAPPEMLAEYIEELALWGYNLLFTWFDMSWYTAGFWDDPNSAGMCMIEKLGFIARTARACGMRVGMTAIANEGFRSQPPAELRADASVRRGGFYLESQICPSKPGGLEMILQNRRKVLELLGNFDFYWHWAYDQGGCGCEQCSDPPGVRWGAKFLELGQIISGLVRQFNPQAKFYLSTWLMDTEEHGMIEDLCRQGADWFDGVLYETHTLDDHPLPAPYQRMVFPEISMFDCYFTSYGCNGANPAPCRFAEQARRVVNAGAGAVLYSEGMFEDINKITWAAMLWDPRRDIADVMREYAAYYFGLPNADTAANLIFALEETWGAEKLCRASLPQVQAIFEGLLALEQTLPQMTGSYLRWRALRDRAEIDLLMKQIPYDEPLIGTARFLMDETGCTDDLPALRRRLQAFCQRLQARQDGVERLFEAHWAYMTRFFMQRTSLVFLPDDAIGGRDFAKLLSLLREALAQPDDEAMRQAAMRAFKRWLWLNGIRIEHLFLAEES